jgi:hypothetical protein
MLIALTDIGGAWQRAVALSESIGLDTWRLIIVILGVLIALIGIFWDRLPFTATIPPTPLVDASPSTGEPTPTAPTAMRGSTWI